MAKHLDNPFLVTGYESPQYFCNRNTETEGLMNALRNGRNVTLTSPRRLGKTGLIKHTFYQLKKSEPKSTVVYMDLFPTENLAEFTKLFASSILGQLDSNPSRVLKLLTDIFKGLRPSMSVDPVTGFPKIGVDIVAGTEESTLEQVFDYLKKSEKTCYIAFDEFQQIARYPEKNVEAILRSHIQDMHNVHFIFSGSQAHMLGEMFHSPQRPFYQSTSGMSIGVIDEAVYYDFASEFFSRQGRTLPKEVFGEIYRQYDGYTWYIQMMMNRLYAKSSRLIDLDLARECLNDILSENEFYYQHLLSVYSKGQSKLIKAIAKEGTVRELTSGSFISKYGLTATSSVKTAVNRMLEEEVIYRGEGGYLVYDRFFGQWLKEKF